MLTGTMLFDRVWLLLRKAHPHLRSRVAPYFYAISLRKVAAVVVAVHQPSGSVRLSFPSSKSQRTSRRAFLKCLYLHMESTLQCADRSSVVYDESRYSPHYGRLALAQSSLRVPGCPPTPKTPMSIAQHKVFGTTTSSELFVCQ